jgi:hypothetical protein
MLDITGILLSCVAVLWIIVQATKRDRTEPWFQTVKDAVKAKSAPPAPWRRQR